MPGALRFRQRMVGIVLEPLAQLALHLRSSRPLILMYHGISAAPRPGSNELRNVGGKHLPLDTFVRQVRLLHKHRHVLSIGEMVEGLIAARPLENCVALTFDDGYRNNHDVAAPVLADLRLPGAFFLITHMIDSGTWMWIDRLECIFDRTHVDNVDVPVLGEQLSLRNAAERLHALRRVKLALRRRDPAFAAAQVADLAQRLEVTDAAPDGDYRFMTWDHARALHAAGFEVGAHTVNHPMLAEISLEAAIAEIRASRGRILDEVGHCSQVFCYPFGKTGDFSAAVREFCRQEFRAALSTNRGTASLSELFQLPRIGAPAYNLGTVLMSVR